MTALTIAPNSDLGLRRIPQTFVWTAVFALIVFAAAGAHIAYGANSDVSWLITVDEKWLEGAVPYKDIIEVNPPASLLLYLPAVALGRLLRRSPEFCVAVFGFAFAGLSLAFAQSLQRLGGAPLAPAYFAIALAAFLLLPGISVDERDVLAAFAALPCVVLLSLRVEHKKVSIAAALTAGAMMGVTVAIKPPYALIVATLAPWILVKLSRGSLACWPEALATVIVVAAYGAAVMLAFPYFVSDVLPIAVAIYAPIREGLGRLLVNYDTAAASLMVAA